MKAILRQAPRAQRWTAVCSSLALFGLNVWGGGGCARNLVTHRPSVKLISEKTEIHIGQQVKEEIVKEYSVFKSSDVQTYVEAVTRKITEASDRPRLTYHVTILDTEVVNAFAAPGGFLFVTRGLLAVIADEAEFAAVLAHEVGHVAAWHGISMLERQMGLAFLVALGTITVGTTLGGAAAEMVAQASSTLASLYALGYSREYELQADEAGLRYTLRAGYDPEAMVTFLQRLKRLEEEESIPAERVELFYRTHPPTKQRIRLAKRWLAKTDLRSAPLAYHADQYLAMRKKLPTGEPPERGRVEGRRYMNPVYGLKLEVPPHWTLDNSRVRSLVGFVSPDQQARGELQRQPLEKEMTPLEFGQSVEKQWGVPKPAGKQVSYPAGPAFLDRVSGGRVQRRILCVVRGKVGYVLLCEAPVETFLKYLVEFEQIMRSFQFVSPEKPTLTP
ncbi:MAG: M48 family metalloprotease [Elusimicrobia bacterium]|nr:M48 family metalloprotease [Elusimicrobiota bacterium]